VTVGVPSLPARRRPIETVDDVDELVKRFYQAAIPDPQLGPIFEAFGVDWSVHIPKLVAFWCRELLGVPGYTGRPVGAHGPVLDARPFGGPEIDRWVELWSETVDERFTGEIAALARRRAGLAGAAIAHLTRRHASTAGGAYETLIDAGL
jgi:hemoglobin